MRGRGADWNDVVGSKLAGDKRVRERRRDNCPVHSIMAL